MKSRGLTLVDVLLVICFIAILAALVVPHLLRSGTKAREKDMIVQLEMIRAAVDTYKEDSGSRPESLTMLLEMDKPKDKGGGKYLHALSGGLPNNVVAGGNVEGDHWLYDPSTGEVRAKAGEALDGTDYSNW